MKTTQTPPTSSRHAGFTLIELLTVITIIVLLVGITLGIMSYAKQTGVTKKAESQMELIITGLEKYYVQFGEYPEPVDNTGKGSDGAKALYQALTGDGSDELVVAGGQSESTGDVGTEYDLLVEGIDPKANKHKIVGKGYLLVDPFGQPWFYRKHIKGDSDPTRNSTYDLWSVGTDHKKENEAKWIKNW